MSLSLNVPGYPKSNPTVHSFFGHCLTELKYYLKAHLVGIMEKEAIERVDDAGDFYIVPCLTGRLSFPEMKQLCEGFEEGHQLGRFVDVDLNDFQGNTISSGKSKMCFFCRVKPAIECRRSNSHGAGEVRSFMFEEMANYCRQQREKLLIKRLSSLGLQALLYEISLTPKPGLVDKFSSGSHADMNFRTFLVSSAAISVWFEDLARAGFSFRGNDLTQALPVIRQIGLRMEASMYESTHNINTQKGIIFLMGLSLFACGKLYSQTDQFDSELFREILRGICKDLTRKELYPVGRSEKSHGEEIYRKYGFSGARGEAETGFRTVFEFGLPQLESSLETDDAVLFKCFLAISSNTNDTNILYRRGPDVLSSFQELCKTALENFNEANYSKVAEFCKSKNISPGGSADLLVVSIFLGSVISADKRKDINPLSLTNDF